MITDDLQEPLEITQIARSCHESNPSTGHGEPRTRSLRLSRLAPKRRSLPPSPNLQRGIGQALAALLIVLVFHSPICAQASPSKIRLLIVDGQNNHDWRATTAYLRTMFEDSGRFEVEVNTTPPSPQTPDGKRYIENPEQYDTDMALFRPWFEKFDVILLNYNGLPWPNAVHELLEKSVEEGKGLVVIHAADNAFPGRSTYDRMIGLGWRLKTMGARIGFDDSGQQFRIESGEGPDSGHGKRHAFPIAVRAPDHPIMQGMPTTWMHARDELYHGLRGPAKELTVLATAYSDPAQDGTGVHEPMAWTVNFGKGRIFHTPLGHDVSAMKCVGFITLVLRGSEWAATGEVTIPIPSDFPTADSVRTRGNWMSDGSFKNWLVWLLAVPIGVMIVAIVWRRWQRRRGESIQNSP